MYLYDELQLDNCPHCSTTKPRISLLENNGHPVDKILTTDHSGETRRIWSLYVCSTCGGVVLAAAPDTWNEYEEEHELPKVNQIFPKAHQLSEDIPKRAAYYLSQAKRSLSTPAGSIMVSASAVDAMLKELGLKTGTLNERINLAAKDNIITNDMAEWAHSIRLEANAERHVDDVTGYPTLEDAERSYDFARALAEILFVLPAQVKRGKDAAKRGIQAP